MKTLKIVRERKGDWDEFHLSGAMNEDAGVQLIRLYGEAAPKARFVFRDVEMVNSNGIRAWVLFLRDFQLDREVQMAECSPVILDQMNMLPSFVGKAKVLSVYVPFECGECGAVTNCLIEAADFEAAKRGERAGKCKKCGRETRVMDEVDPFSFVRESA